MMAFGRRPSCKAICKYSTLVMSLIALGCSAALVVVAVIIAIDTGWHLHNPRTRQLHVILRAGQLALDYHHTYTYRVSCIIVGTCVVFYFFLAGLLGFYGSLKSRFNMVVFFCVMFGVAVLCELGFVTYVGVLMWRDRTAMLIPQIPHLLRGAMRTYHTNPHSQRAVDWIQTELRCCGATAYPDWDINEYFNCGSSHHQKCSVPDSCCILPPDKPNAKPPQRCALAIRNVRIQSLPTTIYRAGCITPLQEWVRTLEPRTLVPVWALLVLAALQMLAVIFGSLFAYIMRLPLEHWLRGNIEPKPPRVRHRCM